MTFTPKDWRNSPEVTTPLSAAALENLETRVTDYTDDHAPSFSVMDYGATADGVTDDTAEIQATINACATAGGGIVYFPPGTYMISQIYPKSNMTLSGAGCDVTVLTANSASEPIINFNFASGNSNITIRNLTVDGDGGTTGFLLRIIDESDSMGCSNCLIDNVELKNGEFGLQFDNMAQGMVRNCYIHDNTRDGFQAFGTDLMVQGCAVLDNGDDAVAFIGNPGTALRCSAVGNVLGDVTTAGSTHAGVAFAGVRGGVASGNVIRGGYEGVYVGDYNAIASAEISISGNTFEHPGLAQDDAGFGVRITGADSARGGSGDAGVSDVVIAGNVFRSPRGYGIVVQSNDTPGTVSNVSISSNILRWESGDTYEAWAYGMWIGNAADNRVVENVKVTDNLIVRSPGHGIYVGDTPSGNVRELSFSGNTLLNPGSGAGGSGIWMNGGGTVSFVNNRIRGANAYGINWSGTVTGVSGISNDIRDSGSGDFNGTPDSVVGQTWLHSIASANVANSMMFINSTGGTLTFKDSGGSTHNLY